MLGWEELCAVDLGPNGKRGEGVLVGVSTRREGLWGGSQARPWSKACGGWTPQWRRGAKCGGDLQHVEP